jgi:hypothetical protein
MKIFFANVALMFSVRDKTPQGFLQTTLEKPLDNNLLKNKIVLFR